MLCGVFDSFFLFLFSLGVFCVFYYVKNNKSKTKTLSKRLKRNKKKASKKEQEE